MKKCCARSIHLKLLCSKSTQGGLDGSIIPWKRSQVLNGGEPRGPFLASPCSVPSTSPVHRRRHARSPQKPVLGRKRTWHNCLSHPSRDVSPRVNGCRRRPTCPMRRRSLPLKGHLCPTEAGRTPGAAPRTHLPASALALRTAGRAGSSPLPTCLLGILGCRLTVAGTGARESDRQGPPHLSRTGPDKQALGRHSREGPL